MALTFKHRRSGRVVKVLEPSELEQSLAKVVNYRGRTLDKDRIKVAVKRRKRTIEKMGDCHKWERVEGTAARASKPGNGTGAGTAGNKGS